MKILHAYTLRSLRLNKTRTLVTIIGIILSVALFTAVTEGAYSGQQYMIRVAEESMGGFHLLVRDMTAQEVETLRQTKGVKELVTSEEVGYADLGLAEHAYTPYLYVATMSDGLSEMAGVHLTQGRLPENDTELILSNRLSGYQEEPWTVGQTVTLSMFQRFYEGYHLGQGTALWDDETMEPLGEKTYTIVGIYEGLSYQVEGYSAPGHLALTAGSGTSYNTAYVTLDDPDAVYSLRGQYEETHDTVVNSELLMMYGTTSNEFIVRTLYSMMAILLGLIMFGSISLIYNSFSISVNERTKQFGLLKSIGATKRQIRSMVLYEAAVLCLIAIPLGLLLGCGGIGITLYCLRDKFAGFVGLSVGMEQEVQIKLVLNWWPILLAAGIGVFTTLLSAWLPAKRAVKRSAIESIRQTADVKLEGKRVKTSRLTAKLFGFPGMLASKNFKRSRKKYRITVLSLTASLVLFIAASSFSMYMTESVDMAIDEEPYDISFWESNSDEKTNADFDQTLTLLLGAQDVTQGTYVKVCDYEEVVLPQTALSKEVKSLSKYNASSPTLQPDGNARMYVNVLFVSDNAFRQLLKENGLREEDYFNPDAPLALAYDYNKDRIYYDEGYVMTAYHLFNADHLPISASLIQYDIPEGYIWYNTEESEDGTTYLWLAPPQTNDDKTVMEGEIKVPDTQYRNDVSFTIGAVLEKQPYFASSGRSLIFPVSLQPQILPDRNENTMFYFCAENHEAATTQMKELLEQNQGDSDHLHNLAKERETVRGLITVVNVFSYGFIILISLIAAANVFNTISTNLMLRQREFAMLQSVGMTGKAFYRMMNYECLLYGLKTLLYGLPLSFGVTWLIYKATDNAFSNTFHLPWGNVALAVGSIFVVVFATMFYTARKLRKQNIMEALQNENI